MMPLSFFMPILPEIFLLVMGCAALLLGVFLKNGKAFSYFLVQMSLLVTALLVWWVSQHHLGIALNGLFLLDHFSVY